MKSILIALLLCVSIVSCHGPEQNSTVGNSEDSTTIKAKESVGDTSTSLGAGVDNSGGTPGASMDTAKKADTTDQRTKKNKALKK